MTEPAEVPKKTTRKRNPKKKKSSRDQSHLPTTIIEETDVTILSMDHQKGKPTAVLALDCECVGGGEDGKKNILARVSIVNQFGEVVYDEFIEPVIPVVDYRTAISGVLPEDLVDGVPFKEMKKETAKILRGRLVVGHSVHYDFKMIKFWTPYHLVRDTANCRILTDLVEGKKTPSLKTLVSTVLEVEIQKEQHDSVSDARAALLLYLSVKTSWELDIRTKRDK